MKDADWKSRYHRSFLPILQGLERTESFALIPVELPDRELGYELARWLGAHGHPVHVLRVSAWRDLSTKLYEQAPGGRVMVIGPEEVTADFRAALALVNLHRDGIARYLGAPLLWCGNRAMMIETAERAPDFWSVRELGFVLVPPESAPELALPLATMLRYDGVPSRELEPPYRSEPPGVNRTRLGLAFAKALAGEGQLNQALSLLEELDAAPTNPVLSTEWVVLGAYCRSARGEKSAADVAAIHSFSLELLIQAGVVEQAAAVLIVGEGLNSGMLLVDRALQRFRELGDLLWEARMVRFQMGFRLNDSDSEHRRQNIQSMEELLRRGVHDWLLEFNLLTLYVMTSRWRDADRLLANMERNSGDSETLVIASKMIYCLARQQLPEALQHLGIAIRAAEERRDELHKMGFLLVRARLRLELEKPSWQNDLVRAMETISEVGCYSPPDLEIVLDNGWTKLTQAENQKVTTLLQKIAQSPGNRSRERRLLLQHAHLPAAEVVQLCIDLFPDERRTALEKLADAFASLSDRHAEIAARWLLWEHNQREIEELPSEDISVDPDMVFDEIEEEEDESLTWLQQHVPYFNVKEARSPFELDQQHVVLNAAVERVLSKPPRTPRRAAPDPPG